MIESEQIVYISCVEEVRYSFISHLSEALRRKGIHDVFVDCDDLLSKESQSKVERARVSVMVLPGNHKVNLDKLAKVLECQKNKDQVVVPVLYGVIPLDFEWRRALESKGFFSSFHYSRNECTDSELVEEITRDVYEKLFYMERIGIYSKLQGIENMVWKQPFGVRCVGIWGMLGIGKTTLAKAVFDQMSGDFDAYCFIEDYEKVIHEKGLYRLLEEHFLKEKPGAGSTITKLSLLSNKLNNTRVLVVLDDVRNALMAEPLLGGFGWFSPKSLIIITSRDKQVFRLCRVNQIYKVQGLNEKEALQLFTLSACIKNNGEQNFHELSMKVIEYANGNPLALSIYGREFKGKSNLSEMETTFLELKGRPHFQIVDAFKSSYDSLNDRERNIFLDIACFFQGENVDYVMQLLGGCGFLPHVGIDVLVEKCLVTISEKRVWMHNLIQDVGQKIIYTETEQIGRRSRLWEPESIKYLLEDNEHIANVEPKTTSKHAQGTEEIEGMFLDTSNISFDIKPVAFDNMLNLRFLKIYCSNPKIHPVINFSNGSLRYLPNELRLLHWENYPLQFLPENFDPMHLVEINMPYSQLQTLWGKPKNLKMLRTIRLCHSQKLVDVGDLSKAQYLEVIDLQGCTGLQSFPATDKLLHLRVVNLSGCSEIKEFPEVRPNIEALHLQATGIRKLIIFKPNGGKLASLSELEGLSNALKLELLARLEKSRSSSQDVAKLICLELKDCTCLQSLPNMVNLELLKVLDLSGCSELKTIKGFPPNLKELSIAGTAVREVPLLPQGLELFNAHGCASLKSIHLDSKKLHMHYTFSNCFDLYPQVINNFLVKALANAEHIPRERQQQLNKSPAFSFCAPSHANQNSTLDLQPGFSVMTRLIPSWRKTLVGFAMLVEVAFSEDYGNATGFGISCVCRWSNKEGRSHMTRRNLHCWGLGKAVQKDHMFVFFDVNMRPSTDEGNDPDIWADLVVFEFFPVDKQTKPSCTVRGCGVRVITDANCNTSIENILPVWSLDPMEVSGNEDEEALRISYDGLQEIDKALFRYIVGLFNDEDVGLVAPHIANIFDMDVSNGLKVLADRSLIRVSSNGEIVMPCLLRQMGHEILHTESKKIERLGDDSMANTMKTEKSKGKEVVCIMDAGSQSAEEEVESSEKSITGSPNPRYLLPDSSSNSEITINAKKVEITHSENPENPTRDTSHALTNEKMDDRVSLGLGSLGGAVFSELLKLVIEEGKKVKAFKPLSKDLVLTMERLLPLTEMIDSMQNELGVKELKDLMDMIERARVAIQKFPSVPWYKKSKYTRKIERINEDMLKFCQIDLQILQHGNQLKLLGLRGNLVNTVDVDGIGKRMDLLSVHAPVFRDLCSVPKLDKVLVGFELPLMELKKRLLDNSVVSLVVSAPPGCGKTSLVTQLCDDPEIKGNFKHIFFNVVSSTPNFRVIVQNLLQHNGYEARTFENDSQAVVGLRKLLEELQEKGRILLVLDDVWRGAESLLQKFQIRLPNYKILVTSRFEFPSFGSNYHLKPLEDEDARALLIHCASRPYNASSAEYEDLLQKILKLCNGFPIVIKVVGVSLKGKSLNTWKGQVKGWSEGEKLLDSPHPTMLECLQPSFDALESNLKECFLDMGSFLEDHKIRASTVIDIWVELYGKGSTLCMKYLEDLASLNLLELISLGNEHEEGFYNEFLVTQHNILRELAIHQSKLKENLERKRLNLKITEDKFPEWCLNPRHPIINASLLSISTDDLFSSHWVEMDCPYVEALVLNLSSSDYALPSFVAGMTKLKVLTITNHGFFPARLSNFGCLNSLPNLKRIRLEKVSITLLDILQLKLRSLKKLSLVMCSFGEVFYDIEEIDVSNALSSLQEIEIDYCYDLDELPYWVSEVLSLKTLSITNCSKLSILPKAMGNLSKLEVLRLSSCINLSELPETIGRLSNLQFLDISHCLGLRKLPQEIGKLDKLKMISMRKCSGCELPDSLRNLENLEVKCD